AKAAGPEGLLDPQIDFAVLRKRRKHALGVGRFFDLHGDVKSLRFLEMLRRIVGSHESLVADVQASVHDLLPPLCRHLLACRRAFVGHHGRDFAVKNLFVELEGCLALAVEKEIRIELHVHSWWLDWKTVIRPRWLRSP